MELFGVRSCPPKSSITPQVTAEYIFDNGACVNSDGNTGTIIKNVFSSDLCLGVRSCPPKSSITPQVRDLLVHLMSKYKGQGHALLSFIGSISEHKTLISSSSIISISVYIYTSCYVRALLFKSNK